LRAFEQQEEHSMPIAVNRARLKSERRKRGWSQDHLAAASGLSTRTVQRLEAGADATLSSLAALAATLALSFDAITSAEGAVRRSTPLSILADIVPTLDRFRAMGFGVIETEDPGCVGVVAGSSHQLLCSRAFMIRYYPAHLITPLLGKTIPYVWVSSLENACRAWSRVAHRTETDHGTREALVQAGDEWAILAETCN
jgi:transcriptional regulator with XRE-family HTH domain